MNHMQEVTCPKCGKKQECLIWDTINTERDEGMKEKVRSGKMLEAHCPECGVDFLLNYSFLYQEMESHEMIYVCVDDTSEEGMKEAFANLYAQQEKRREADLEGEDMTCRIVHSYNELKEKLLIADAGLDDRIVEIIKSSIWHQVETEHEELHIDEIFFVTNEENIPGLIFRSEGTMVTSMEFDMPLYEAIKENALSAIEGLSSRDFTIDRAWAERMVEKLG